jgi:AAA family ATP:ADP antiporter
MARGSNLTLNVVSASTPTNTVRPTIDPAIDPAIHWRTRIADFALPVRGADRTHALQAFVLFALLMLSYYVFKPIRGSLYIHYVGAKHLPWVYLASALVAGMAMALYNRYFVSHEPRRLLTGTLWVLAALAGLFWVAHLAQWGSPGLRSLIFFLWVSLYGALVSTIFWSLANDVFPLDVGPKVFSFIGMGGIIGAALGSIGTEFAVRQAHWGTEALIPLGAGLLLLSIPLVHALRPANEPSAASRSAPCTAPRHDGFYWIVQDRYIRHIAALVYVTFLAATLLDLEYNRIVEASIPGKEAKTAFFGGLYAWVNVIALLTQLLVTGPLHRRLGPLPGLLTMPIVGIAAIGVLILTPSLPHVSVVWAIGLGLTYSVYQASKELLYGPTNLEVKYGAKAYIDVFFFRLGDGSASVLALVLGHVLARSIMWTAPLMAVLLSLWGLVLAMIRREYRVRVRTTPKAAP